jgi:hypothetical protein
MGPQAAIAGTVTMMLLIAASGIAIGYGFGTTLTNSAQPQSVTVTSTASGSGAGSNSSSPFVVTLVVTTENSFNSTIGAQPAYYVLGPNGPESAANLALPAHRLIKLVIICYDTGPANLTSSQYAKVSGTQNNTMTVVNNTNVNSSQGASGIQVNGGDTVSALPLNGTAHTFTIPQLGINIPLAPSSTTTALITINQTGTFTWFCMTVCGSGPDGKGGAMATPGWMTGNVAAN